MPLVALELTKLTLTRRLLLNRFEEHTWRYCIKRSTEVFQLLAILIGTNFLRLNGRTWLTKPCHFEGLGVVLTRLQTQNIVNITLFGLF